MDERLVTELETAIADVGALLVRLQKYRVGAGDAGAALARAAMTLGDEARRRSRRGRLDDAGAVALRADAMRLADDIRALVASVHASAAYRAAVTAHAAGDGRALAPLLPGIFDGVELVDVVPDLFHAVTWRRRNRPRAAADVVAEVARLRADGLEASGDDVSPGTDPLLPAVVLHPAPPEEEPIVLRIAAGTLDVPVHRLVDTGECLVHVARLRAPLDVVLASALGVDAVESTPVDYARWRDELARALAAARIPFTSG